MAANYSLHYLKKSLSDVSETDLIQFFITQQEESDTIELKSYINWPDGRSKAEKDKEKLNSIISTICAFLNSEGGILIWGAPEEGRERRPYTSNLTPVDIELSKDQLMSKIIDSISPLPSQINITDIAVSGGYCYLLEVQKSEYSPHQYKGTYYMRIDGATHPAPHHYVEALMKKITYPKLNVKLSLSESRHKNHLSITPMLIRITNDSKLITAKNINFKVTSSNCYIVEPDTTLSTVFNYSSTITKSAGDIIHYGMPIKIFFLIITKEFSSSSWNDNITVSIWADNAPLLFSEYKLIIYPRNGGYSSIKILSKNENLYYMNRIPDESEDSIAMEIEADLKNFTEDFYNQ